MKEVNFQKRTFYEQPFKCQLHDQAYLFPFFSMPSKNPTFKVERIMSKRRTPKGDIQYQVKWLGYESDADLTWEPLNHLSNCADLVDEYQRTIGRNTAIRTEPRSDSSNKNLKRPRPSSTSMSKEKHTPVRQPDLEDREIYEDESNDNAEEEYTDKPVKKQTAIRSTPKAAPEPPKKPRIIRKPVQDNNIEQDNSDENNMPENLNQLCTGNKGKYEVLSIMRENENKNNYMFKVKVGRQEKTMSKDELIQDDPHSLLYYYEKNIQFITSK